MHIIGNSTLARQNVVENAFKSQDNLNKTFYVIQINFKMVYRGTW